MKITRIIADLWWSKLRFLVEPILRRISRNKNIILTGPLRGCYFKGGLAQILGIYEFQVQETLLSFDRKDNIFYDIGANNGFFTLLAALKLVENGHVFAFEPLPKNLDQIYDVVKKNKIINCSIKEIALSDRNGETDLFYNRNGATPSILMNINDDMSRLRVKTISLDQFINNNPTPSIIKLDVEGAECKVLKGSNKLLSSNNPLAWIIEIHNIESEICVRELLQQNGYSIKNLPNPRKRRNQFPKHIIAKNYAK